MNRLATPSLNSTAHKVTKTPKATPATDKAKKETKRSRAAQKAVAWSHAVTATAIVLSAGLNGYAAAVEAPSLTGKVVGAVLGASVPVVVWLLSQVTAYTYRAGWTYLSIVPGAVACVLLVLSVTHCAGAFSALTGTGWMLSVCLAVGIDCGLVSSEAVAILVSVE